MTLSLLYSVNRLNANGRFLLLVSLLMAGCATVQPPDAASVSGSESEDETAFWQPRQTEVQVDFPEQWTEDSAAAKTLTSDQALILGLIIRENLVALGRGQTDGLIEGQTLRIRLDDGSIIRLKVIRVFPNHVVCTVILNGTRFQSLQVGDVVTLIH